MGRILGRGSLSPGKENVHTEIVGGIVHSVEIVKARGGLCSFNSVPIDFR